ncbi:Holo-[acyl-carrier-protein] synthase [Frankliniella fusca]|uniref:Regulatory protein zeste n=1 Tax=Frankliniella fusca TaxID=407009 RepID=A0AAE1GVY3_9NEOP|nr:Holo-[acyl-carrier-protein] synthase [Frankliniella fusca]
MTQILLTPIWNRLLDAVAIDRELQGEFMGPGAARRIQGKWEQLAANLNAMGGAFKTGDKWREAFANLRNRAKRQYADRSRYLRGTGGGPPPPASLGLSHTYQRALAFVPQDQLFGVQGIPAPIQVTRIYLLLLTLNHSLVQAATLVPTYLMHDYNEL